MLADNVKSMKADLEKTYLYETDNDSAYPQLPKIDGSPFEHIPKKILAIAMQQPPNSNKTNEQKVDQNQI